MADAKTLKPFIRSWEGGYANIPYDKGGHTKWGITIATFRSVYGNLKTVEDLKAMTEEQWWHIYKVFFWNRWRGDEIKSQSVANILVDWVWASGAHGVRNVQNMLGVKVDGVVGPKTIAALNGYDMGQRVLFDKIKVIRTEFINTISTGKNARFKRGWIRRLSSIQWGKLIHNDGKITTFEP